MTDVPEGFVDITDEIAELLARPDLAKKLSSYRQQHAEDDAAYAAGHTFGFRDSKNRNLSRQVRCGCGWKSRWFSQVQHVEAYDAWRQHSGLTTGK